MPVDFQVKMFICNFCSNRFGKLITLKKHIFSSHLLSGTDTCKLVCDIEGCVEQLNDKFSLRKHLQRKHKGKKWNLPKSWYKELPVGAVVSDIRQNRFSAEEIGPSDVSISFISQHQSTISQGLCNDRSSANLALAKTDNDVCINEFNINENDDYNIAIYKSTMKNLHLRKVMMAQSLCKLKSDYNLTDTALTAIQEWTEDILEEGIRTVIGGIKSYVQVIPTHIENVFQLGLGMANPFIDVRTELQRRKVMPCLIVS